jgi:DNA adenine methylase
VPTAPKSFLRWAGGKHRLLDVLLPAVPRSMGAYHEPFLGGGALLFALQHPGRRCVNDVNSALVTTYRVLRDRPEELIAALRAHAGDTSAAAYYALRAAASPDEPVAVGARFIALNRLGWRGLHRVNRAGRLNTPYGHLRRPTVCDEQLLRADAAALAGVDITCGSYTDALTAAAAGDFVYLDPPYLPGTPAGGFTAYDAAGFTVADHRALAGVIADLDARGVQVMLSNSDTPLTRELFGDLRLHTVRVHRSIAASAAARGVAAELLGVNYPTATMREPARFAALAGVTELG